MSLQLESILIAVIIAAACALPGVFLVLRRSAMVSDAIGHTVLFGIVVAYLIVRDADSIWLTVGAVAAGLLTVWLIELQRDSGLMREDSAIGLVFPLLFSIAVLLISRYTADLHLDTDSVLLGELAFAPFDRLTLFGLNLPRALWIGSAVFLLNGLLLLLFAKELALSTFDAALARTLGFAPLALHYGLMSSVSLTAVSAFDAVGAILVVALMVGPPAAARLLVDRLPPLILLSLLFAVLSALLGYAGALWLNTTIAGAIAVSTALITTAAFAVQQLRQSRARRRG
jgi:manganese/zinc/iron transport system permease protein